MERNAIENRIETLRKEQAELEHEALLASYEDDIYNAVCIQNLVDMVKSDIAKLEELLKVS